MSRHRKRPAILPDHVLDRFKYEVAEDLGLLDAIDEYGWPNMRSRECGRVGGRIGGSMVRTLIRRAEADLARGRRL